MKNTLKIRIHARAGQGAKTLAQFVAESAAKQDLYVQAFPYYGPERSGAPMDAFVRISPEPIRIHSPIKNPDVVVILDDTLSQTVDICKSLGDSGAFIINTKKSEEDIKKEFDCPAKIHAIDATGVAIEIFGKDFSNTVMLGALAKLSSELDIKSINEVVRDKFEKKYGKEMADKNLEAIKKGHDAIK